MVLWHRIQALHIAVAKGMDTAMLKDITLGQYYPANSIIHRMDPRVKLFGTLLYIVTLFLARNPVVYIIAAAFLFVCIRVSKVPMKFIMRGLKTIIIILLISVSFNVFFTDGHVLVRFWKFKITEEGLIQAAYMGVRLILLIMGSSLMTLTTTPNNLTDGLEKSLRFLAVIRIPVHDIAMMMSIALRFIPILMEEADKIMKAQSARGADFETGGLIKKAKALIPIFVPLFISAIRRAYDLATAMESRCYKGGKGRTKMRPLRYKRADIFGYLILFAYLGVVITTRVLWNNYF